MFYTSYPNGKIINKEAVSRQLSFPSLCLLWHCGPLGLPQVVMDGKCIHADRHGLGRDQVKLFPVRAILIQFVHHLLSDALGPRASELVDLLSVRIVAIKCPKLTASVPEEDDVVVGITLLQLLHQGKGDRGEGKWGLLRYITHAAQ